MGAVRRFNDGYLRAKVLCEVFLGILAIVFGSRLGCEERERERERERKWEVN
jgi:hypothetical protein